MSTRIKVVVGLAGIVLFAAIVFLTLQQNQQRYEVCVKFSGRNHCATAAGRTGEEAIQAAHSIACTMVTSGRDDNMACMQAQPASIRPLSGK